jgi:prophage tail gpP-like protein
MAAPDDTVTLVIKGQTFAGWQSVTVQRGVERCPSSFDLAVTERYPDQPARIDIQPFDPCTVMIGGDVVLTGWVDRYAAEYSASAHSIRIQGRSLCQDLVDCSAVIEGAQISGASVLALAQQLAEPFKVKVTSLVGPGPAIEQFNVILTETPYEIIERVARYTQLLVYDGTDGNLVLAQAGGGGTHASGFVQGVNVEAASVVFSGDERFSKYIAVMMTVDRVRDIGVGGNFIDAVLDETVPRFRPHIIASEQLVYGEFLAKARIKWEMARRIGRSQALRVTCDSWRDSAGRLWTPNALAPISIPALKLVPDEPWVIGAVSYSTDNERGTVADLILMPKSAFEPEPNVLQLFDWQVGKALQSTPRRDE